MIMHHAISSQDGNLFIESTALSTIAAWLDSTTRPVWTGTLFARE